MCSFVFKEHPSGFLASRNLSLFVSVLTEKEVLQLFKYQSLFFFPFLCHFRFGGCKNHDKNLDGSNECEQILQCSCFHCYLHHQYSTVIRDLWTQRFPPQFATAFQNSSSPEIESMFEAVSLPILYSYHMICFCYQYIRYNCLGTNHSSLQDCLRCFQQIIVERVYLQTGSKKWVT